MGLLFYEPLKQFFLMNVEQCHAAADPPTKPITCAVSPLVACYRLHHPFTITQPESSCSFCPVPSHGG